ncbi:MAG TPA: hypothetical protein VFK05_18775 [Polyangiaceae bacterium]|nr:hypothetical protein [Polyangiaceae bacterium]
MNLKNRLKPFTAVAFTALAISTLVAGCSDIQGVQDAACCKEFEAGADMSTVDFGVDASIKGTFSAFASAASDLSAVGTGAVSDVTTACRNIALDLGADADDPKVKGVGGTAALTAWCDLAKAQINATFGASGSLGAKATVNFNPPKCTASLTAQANCQASCDVNAQCDIKANPPMCTGGTLTVECSGSCTASGSADVACTGSCTGKCSGSCKASGGVKVDCKGKCEGTCTAGAAGGATEKGTGIQADGSCNGQCEGTCTLDADAPKIECKGQCDGHCDATCKGSADVKVKCDGKCDADYTPLKCEGGELSGGCSADANCQGSCNASASAKAECTPPSITVEAEAKAGLSADAKVQYETAIASLEANIPKILVVLKARGDAFYKGIQSSVEIGGKLAASGKLGAKGTVCGVLIGSTMGTAGDNFKAALDASASVTGAVTLKQN